jgi:formyltetrahydrofolate hydrolase
MMRIGRDARGTVPARAVDWHHEDRMIVHGSGTVVF